MITTISQNCLITNILFSSRCFKFVTILQLEQAEKMFVEMKVILQKKHDSSHESQDEFTIHPQKR